MKHIKRSKVTEGCTKTRIQRTLCLALAGAMAFSPVAWSDIPDMSIFDNAKEVDDAMLGSMRGRFLRRGDIVQFGVEMVTRWQTAGGEQLRAQVNLDVDMRERTPSVRYQPSLSIVSPANVATATANASQAATAGSGLNNVTGVTQTIQVAGDRNRVQQDTGIVISSEPSAPIVGVTSGPGTQTITSASGASVSATLDQSGVSIMAQVPNQGDVIQRIRGGAVSQGASGLLQATRLTGDLQRVESTTIIRIQTSANAALNNAGMQAALQGMRGLR